MKKILLFMVALAAMFTLSSCEEKIEATHWITYEDGSVNFATNLYLQMKANKLVEFDVTTQANSFFGSEKDAIAWFKDKMNYLESQEFANAEPVVPVLEETSATFILRSSYTPEGEEKDMYGREVERRTVTFKVHSAN